MEYQQPDAWWIQQSLRNPAAFEEIVVRHYQDVSRYLSRSVGSEIGADLTQQTFLVAFEQRIRFKDGEPSARPWLFGIASNLVRRWYRTDSRRRNAYERLSGSNDSSVEFESDLDGRVEAERMRVSLRNGLGSIPRRERDPLLLLALGELSYAEISDALGIPVGTVRSRIHRARGRLRTLLGAEATGAVKGETEPHG